MVCAAAKVPSVLLIQLPHWLYQLQSTYKIRRAECDELAAAAGAEFGISKLADVKDDTLLQVSCAVAHTLWNASLTF